MKNKLSLIAALFFVAQTSFAQQINSGNTTVTYLSAYTNYGGGDVIVRVATPAAGCDGYWMAKSEGGFHMTFALLSLALTKRSPVQIWHEPNQIWGGSSAKFCKIYMVEAAPPTAP